MFVFVAVAILVAVLTIVTTFQFQRYKAMNGSNHRLYDNLKKKHIPKNATAQIASYAYHPGLQLTILSKSVQLQGNGVDCGVYAVPFATRLACVGNEEKESLNKRRLDRT